MYIIIVEVKYYNKAIKQKRVALLNIFNISIKE